MHEDNRPYYQDIKEEKRFFLRCISYGLFFVIILWLIKLIEVILNIEFTFLGVYPLSFKGFPGIFFSPLIHGDFSHLISNSFPLLVLIPMLFYFYKDLGLRIFLLTWLIGNAWLWVIGRESYHIGASGVIYGLAAFLFVSGIIRRHPRLMAISLLVAFLYGGMVWGILPIQEGVSWEGHLMGMIAGIVLAIFFKGEGPQRKIYEWELEEEEEDEKKFNGKTLSEWDEYFDKKARKKQQQNKDKDMNLDGRNITEGKKYPYKNTGTKLKYIYKPKPKDDKSS